MKNFKSKITTLLTGLMIALTFSSFLAIPVYATDAANNKDLTEGTFDVQKNLSLSPNEQPKSYFNTGNQNSPIVSFVITVIDFAITIMGSIAVILFIIAGFLFMTSQGNSQKLDEAKDVIKYAAIGLIVALLSYVITIFVQSIFSNG